MEQVLVRRASKNPQITQAQRRPEAASGVDLQEPANPDGAVTVRKKSGSGGSEQHGGKSPVVSYLVIAEAGNCHAHSRNPRVLQTPLPISPLQFYPFYP